jgi:type III pantothenate kinase
VVLVFDIGNSNIVLGGFEEGKLLFSSRIRTHQHKTADEYTVLIKSVLSLYSAPEKAEGVVISCVVPSLIKAFRGVSERLTDGKVIVLGPGVKTGLNIKIDDPKQLGADFVAGAVGAIKKYSLPLIVADLGTATKFMAIDKDGAMLGGSIMPGVGISADALSNRTACLPIVELAGEVKTVGTNTTDSMRSGIVLGAAAMIDGMAERYKKVLGEEAKTVATGGIAPLIVPHCKEEVILDDNLLLDGLYEIYLKN